MISFRRNLLRGFTSLPDLSWPLVFRVFYRNWLVFLKTWKANIMFNFVEPVLYLWAMGLGLGVYVSKINGLSYVEFLAPGLIASSSMFSTSYEMTYDSFTRMNYHKTFHAMVATPVSMDDVVMGELLYGTFKGLMYGTVFLLITFLFGLVQSPWALLIPVVLALSGMCFAILCTIWTSLAPGYDAFSYFFTLIITPMFLFSGIFFPIETLPKGVQAIAWFTPLYHVVEIFRALVLGKITWAFPGHLAWLVAFIALTIRFPLVMVKNRLVQ